MNRYLLNKPDNNCVHLIFKSTILKRSASMITEEELSKNK